MGFSMIVVDTFVIKGRGVVVTGTPDEGESEINTGDWVVLRQAYGFLLKVQGVERYCREPRPGDPIGILFGVQLEESEIEIGARVTLPL